MSDATTDNSNAQPTRPSEALFLAGESPFLHAPEGAQTIFRITLMTACAVLIAGVVLFGWRAAIVVGLSVVSCIVIESICFRVTRSPALARRSHAHLTGLLLGLTLPAYVPWYVPVVAAAFAIIVGKGIFGGVGHFLWQPALVGRLAVAVLFSQILSGPVPNYPGAGAILAPDKLLVGDITNTRYVRRYRSWHDQPAPEGADAFMVKTPAAILRGLTQTPEPVFSGLATPTEAPRAKPTAIMKLPPINDLLTGTRPGGIGETCSVVILIAGLYLVYRNYVKIHLPIMFLLSAACVAAIAPVRLSESAAEGHFVWYPAAIEGGFTGLTYVMFQLLSGELLLAAFFLAPEMTSRPVTTGGQVIFAIGGGALAMWLKLYVDTPIPAYMAVLAMNTFTPSIDALWRPRVLGQKRLQWLLSRRR